MISDIDPGNSGVIPYSEFKVRIVENEVQRIMGSDETETELLDAHAFVAMGGQPDGMSDGDDGDGEGCVDANKLIQTIKEEF